MGNKIKELDYKNLQKKKKKKNKTSFNSCNPFHQAPTQMYQHNGEICLELGRSGEDQGESKDSLDSLPWKETLV